MTEYFDYQKSKLKKNFLVDCKQNNLVPKGVSLNFNLSLGVNDYLLVDRIENILNQASSNILEAMEEFTENEIERLDDKLENLKSDRISDVGHKNFSREFINKKTDWNVKS